MIIVFRPGSGGKKESQLTTSIYYGHNSQASHTQKSYKQANRNTSTQLTQTHKYPIPIRPGQETNIERMLILTEHRTQGGLNREMGYIKSALIECKPCLLFKWFKLNTTEVIKTPLNLAGWQKKRDKRGVECKIDVTSKSWSIS